MRERERDRVRGTSLGAVLVPKSTQGTSVKTTQGVGIIAAQWISGGVRGAIMTNYGNDYTYVQQIIMFFVFGQEQCKK